MKATIKIEFTAGEEIENAFAEAIRIASILDVWCEFTFNDVTCIACKNSSVKSGADAYFRAIHGEDKIKTAFAN